MGDDITVSVCCVTFNHACFIRHAVDGFLMQITDFPIEIIIHDDCSTDGTAEIVRNYRDENPGLITAILQTENQKSKGKKVFPITFERARGKYIALCEGDDYWIDPLKLQKQVDFLDGHPECAVCFHNVVIFYEDESREPWNRCPVNQKQISTIEDLLRGNFISTCSVMFRRGLFGEFPDWWYTSKVGDWALHILNAQHGKVGYINEVMAAHRIHHGGAWSAQRQDRKLYLETIIEVYEHINAHLNFRYDGLIRARLSECYYDLAMEYADNGNLAKARIYAKRYAIECLSYKHVPGRQLFKLLLRLYVPVLYKLGRLLRNDIRPIQAVRQFFA